MNKISLTRNSVQIAISIFLLYAGYKFFKFVSYFEGKTTELVPRPPSVEAFLPINALIALKNWVVNFDFDPVHPAGLVIFTVIILVSLILKKAFCSWICPVGTLSEGLYKIGQKIFGRNFNLPKPIDYFLMSLKYLVLGFFLKVILLNMNNIAVYQWVRSPYAMIADIKMLKFFTNISQTAAITIAILAILSLFIRSFWCRYLCPYGALLGLVSIFSPFRIVRNSQICDNCKTCTQNCPNHILVHTKTKIWSPECSSCLNCANGCHNNALIYKNQTLSLELRQTAFVAILMIVFFAPIIFSQIAGYWDTSINSETYKELIQNLDKFSHARTGN